VIIDSRAGIFFSKFTFKVEIEKVRLEEEGEFELLNIDFSIGNLDVRDLDDDDQVFISLDNSESWNNHFFRLSRDIY